MNPPAPGLEAGRLGLEAAGLGLLGCLTRQPYDSRVPAGWRCAELLPEARSVLVVASGGRALFAAFRASPEFGRSGDALDAYTRRVVEAAAAGLGTPSRALFAFEQRAGGFADFVALGRAAGLGAPSRLGLLLHPIYGPWMSIRAVVLTALSLSPTPALAAFDPCRGCPAPCAGACHGTALAGERFDTGACASTRHSDPGCRLVCDARRACVVGPEHRYTPEAEAHHMTSPPTGLGTC